MSSGKEKASSGFVHVVSEPLESNYHRPEAGGRYSARLIDVSSVGAVSYLAWQGYDPDTALDHIFVQALGGGVLQEPVCVSAIAGAYGRPCVSCRSGEEADAAWLVEGKQLLVASCVQGKWGEPVRLLCSEGWIRDLTAARGGDNRVWLGFIESYKNGDALVLYCRDGQKWREVERLNVEGFLARPSVAAGRSGELYVARDRYIRGHYGVEISTWQDGRWTQSEVFSDPQSNSLSARLTVDSRGRAWVCYLNEKNVEREGVLGRAAAIRVARLEPDGWVGCGRDDGYELAYLYRGLLPERTYFGYNGLRRNPYLAATDDGCVHLLWEAQRSEEEVWDNINNGYLLGRTFRDGCWGPTRLWHEGGCCFAGDSQTVHAAGSIQWFLRGEHRENGADFEGITIDPAKAGRVSVPEPSAWKDWQPYVAAGTSGERAQIDYEGQKLRLFWGDFHNHSIFSCDAEGYPDELYNFARDVAGVDFAGITDNDFIPNKPVMAGELDYLKHLIGRVEEAGQFLPFYGYEWTFYRDDPEHSYNHRSIVFLDDRQEIVRRNETDGQTQEAFRESLCKMNAFAHAHHAQFEHLGTKQEANVEVASGWAVNIERCGTIHEQLKAGHEFGFVASSDGHRMIPGLGGALTGVWASELSREALIEALRNRRCYATNGNRMVIDFRLNGAMMGSVVGNPAQRRFTFGVSGGKGPGRIKIIRDGESVYELEGSFEDIEGEWVDERPTLSNCWYYLRAEEQTDYREYPHNICQAVGGLAWSSPIRVQIK